VINFFIDNYRNISKDFRHKTAKRDGKPTKYVAFVCLKNAYYLILRILEDFFYPFWKNLLNDVMFTYHPDITVIIANR